MQRDDLDIFDVYIIRVRDQECIASCIGSLKEILKDWKIALLKFFRLESIYASQRFANILRCIIVYHGL